MGAAALRANFAPKGIIKAAEQLVSHESALPQVARETDGAVTGGWGAYVLTSAFQAIYGFDENGHLRQAAAEGLLRPFRDGLAVSPGRFFASVPPDQRMEVETLARTLHILNAAPLPAGSALFLNFNPALFTDASRMQAAIRHTEAALEEATIPPARIVCEVTEEKSGSESLLLDFAESMRELGCRIAVDDFGAAWSDMARIDRLRPDVVKFDAGWVSRLMGSEPGHELLVQMVARFKSLGIGTLFEGIEQTWQLDAAREAGVDMVQGFGLARPELA